MKNLMNSFDFVADDIIDVNPFAVEDDLSDGEENHCMFSPFCCVVWLWLLYSVIKLIYFLFVSQH